MGAQVASHQRSNSRSLLGYGTLSGFEDLIGPIHTIRHQISIGNINEHMNIDAMPASLRDAILFNQFTQGRDIGRIGAVTNTDIIPRLAQVGNPELEKKKEKEKREWFYILWLMQQYSKQWENTLINVAAAYEILTEMIEALDEEAEQHAGKSNILDFGRNANGLKSRIQKYRDETLLDYHKALRGSPPPSASQLQTINQNVQKNVNRFTQMYNKMSQYMNLRNMNKVLNNASSRLSQTALYQNLRSSTSATTLNTGLNTSAFNNMAANSNRPHHNSVKPSAANSSPAYPSGLVHGTAGAVKAIIIRAQSDRTDDDPKPDATYED